VSALQWRCLSFEQLSTQDLYSVLQLRSEVFVVEQNCVFQDMDGSDAQALHLLGEQGGGLQAPPGNALLARPGNALLAYARCFGPGIKYREASIGRVITHTSLRGTGAGHVLMQQALELCQSHWPAAPIRIGAQARLQAFYRQRGFEPASDLYLEDGIDHIEMLRPAQALENA
jgi:ElaA protein